MLGARLFGRLSWRRFFLYGSAASMFLFFAFTLAPIVSPLPAYTGPHDVGVLDLEMEVPRRVVWDARLKDGGREAFEVC
jgi:platelet-activating factor acetylhydrolase